MEKNGGKSHDKFFYNETFAKKLSDIGVKFMQVFDKKNW